jgi:hypothetical protein
VKSRFWRPRDRRRIAQPTPRRDTHVSHDQSPVQIGISPQVPGSMPRAEDDGLTRDRSPAFHDQPGSGKDTSTRYFYF